MAVEMINVLIDTAITAAACAFTGRMWYRLGHKNGYDSGFDFGRRMHAVVQVSVNIDGCPVKADNVNGNKIPVKLNTFQYTDDK